MRTDRIVRTAAQRGPAARWCTRVTCEGTSRPRGSTRSSASGCSSLSRGGQLSRSEREAVQPPRPVSGTSATTGSTTSTGPGSRRRPRPAGPRKSATWAPASRLSRCSVASRHDSCSGTAAPDSRTRYRSQPVPSSRSQNCDAEIAARDTSGPSMSAPTRSATKSRSNARAMSGRWACTGRANAGSAGPAPSPLQPAPSRPGVGVAGMVPLACTLPLVGDPVGSARLRRTGGRSSTTPGLRRPAVPGSPSSCRTPTRPSTTTSTRSAQRTSAGSLEVTADRRGAHHQVGAAHGAPDLRGLPVQPGGGLVQDQDGACG